MSRFLTFLLVLFLGISAQAQEEDEVLMTVGGKAVTVAEFLQAYQKHAGAQKEDLDAFLERFRDYKVKVAYAQQQGYDTLSVVRSRLAYFRKCLEAGQQGVAPTVDDGGLHGTSLYIGHLLLPLPQHAPSASLQYRLKVRMDSVWQEIQGGRDFMEVVNAVSPQTRNEYWISRNHTLADVEDQAYRLKEGEMSQPFLSYDGYHLLKVFRRSDVQEIDLSQATAAPAAPDEFLLTEYADGLLLNELYKRNRNLWEEPAPAELESYFNAHAADYGWDIPHYKGVVYHCQDKKTLKQFQKQFRNLPFQQWATWLKSAQGALLQQKAKVSDVQLFTLSQDPYVDQLAFGGPKAEPVEGYPYTGISGKKLRRGPDDYRDVRAQVVADFEKDREQQWMEGLRGQVEVTLNPEALKELNLKDNTKD